MSKSQISKDFDLKSKLRKLADGGGVIPLTGAVGQAQQTIMGRRSRLDELEAQAMGGAPAPQGQAPAPAPVPQPQQRTMPAVRQGGIRGFFGLADGGASGDPFHRVEVDEAKQVQLANGGKVTGKGGPTDDKVGPVMLSPEEYVLPADTVEAVGRENLDRLRLETHDFKDPRKESALRAQGLANGGSPFIVDMNGNVVGPQGSVQPPRALPGPGMPPPQYPTPALPQAGPQMVKNMGPAQVVPPLPAAAPAPPSRLAGAATSLLRGQAAFGGAAGGVQSVLDTTMGGPEGYRAHSQNALGVETPLGSVAADAGRSFANVGDNITFGLAGRLGRGISNATQGASFTEGFMSPSDRTKFEESRAAPGRAETFADAMGGANFDNLSLTPRASIATNQQGQGVAPVTAGSPQSLRLSEQGVPLSAQTASPLVGAGEQILRTAGTSEYQNLGTYGGSANIYGRNTPGTKPGRMNDFSGVGSPMDGVVAGGAPAYPTSALRAPAAPEGPVGGQLGGFRTGGDRYDQMKKELAGMYGPKGQGNLARKLVEVEGLRQRDEDSVRGSTTTMRGQDIASETSRANAALGASTTMRGQDMDLQGRVSALRANGTAAQLKALLDAQKFSAETEEKGFERYNKGIEGMFTVSTPDGKQTVDKAAQEQFKAFVQGSDPKFNEKFAAMRPQDQAAALQTFKTMFDANQARNATAQSGSWVGKGGGVTNRFDMPVDMREAELNDWANGNLPLGKYIKSNLPFTDKNVVVTESGQAVPYAEYTQTGGVDDLDKQKLVQDSVRRSKLRSN